MSPNENDKKLYKAVVAGNFDGVKAALEAGANINGPPGQPFPPIVAATKTDHAGIVDFLLEHGADPDKPVTSGIPGERALHVAARIGRVEIVRLLLERARADPNATDGTGCTPLMTTTRKPHDFCVEVVRLLLEAGANLSLAKEGGFIPLHSAVTNGHMELFDMLYSRAPATLNRCAADGETPLFLACAAGQDSMVSKLLSLGAMQPMPLTDSCMSPLAMAVMKDFVSVVRIMINEGGISAVGGDLALARGLAVAVRSNRARILRLLLTADGEAGRSEWANIDIGDGHLLHLGAGYCCPAAVSILLEAGADETAHMSEKRRPRDVIGMDIGRDALPQMGRGDEIAIRRMLQRGPAYRARSWAWPSDEGADAGGSGGGDTAAAAATAVLSTSPAMTTPAATGMRIFRAQETSRRELFVRLVDRYCAKN